jgi:chromosomal replication initiator protein DnaA
MGFLDLLRSIFGGKKKPAPRPVRKPRTEVTRSPPPRQVQKVQEPKRVVRQPPKTAPEVQAQRVDQDPQTIEIIKKKEEELKKKEQTFLKELENEWVKKELELKTREQEIRDVQGQLEQERLNLATLQLKSKPDSNYSGGSAPKGSGPYAQEFDKRMTEVEMREAELIKREEMLRKELDALRTEPSGDVRLDLQKREEELRKRELDLQKRAEEIDIDEMMRNIEEKMKEEVTEPLKEYIFDNFVIGDSNRFAFEVTIAVARQPADAYNPLFIYSDVGMGKTHLLNAVGNYIKEQHPEMKIFYVSCEKFTNELINFLQYGKIEEFREKYRTVDVLLIDDIQFIALQQSTQEEFFHTFNTLYNAHKQIVLASDRPPKDIQHLEARLRSRFEGGLIVNIKTPDLSTRKNILEHKAMEAGINLDPKVSDFIARYIQSDVRTLIGTLNNILAHSSLTGRQINLTLVSEVLKNMWPEGLEEVA